MKFCWIHSAKEIKYRILILQARWIHFILSAIDTELETKETSLSEYLMLSPQVQSARSPCHVLVEDLHARHRSRWDPVLAIEPVRARPLFRDAFDEELDAASFPLLCGL